MQLDCLFKPDLTHPCYFRGFSITQTGRKAEEKGPVNICWSRCHWSLYKFVLTWQISGVGVKMFTERQTDTEHLHNHQHNVHSVWQTDQREHHTSVQAGLWQTLISHKHSEEHKRSFRNGGWQADPKTGLPDLLYWKTFAFLHKMFIFRTEHLLSSRSGVFSFLY